MGFYKVKTSLEEPSTRYLLKSKVHFWYKTTDYEPFIGSINKIDWGVWLIDCISTGCADDYKAKDVSDKRDIRGKNGEN